MDRLRCSCEVVLRLQRVERDEVQLVRAGIFGTGSGTRESGGGTWEGALEMIYTDIETTILAELNRNDVQSRVSAWVDQAYRDIMSRYDFSWLKVIAESPTSDGVYRYELPTDFDKASKMALLDGTNSRDLVEIVPEKFVERHVLPTSDAKDRPLEYAIINGMGVDNIPYKELHLWPVPGTVYTLLNTYYIMAPTLSGASSPIIPVKYHSAVVFGGLRFGFAGLREYEAATYWKGEMESVIARMITDDRQRPNVKYVLGQFRPKYIHGGSDHLSPFVRSME